MKALLNKDGSQFLDFPFIVHEIGYESYIDFRAKEQAFFRLNNPEPSEEPETTPEDAPEELPYFKRSFSGDSFTESKEALEKVEAGIEHMFDVLSTVCRGNLELIPVAVNNEDVTKLFRTKFHYNIENVYSEPLSLTRLYCHVVTIINAYKAQAVSNDFTIAWQGEAYTIDPHEAFIALNGGDYTAGEAITLLDFRKRALEGFKEKGRDEGGNIEFNLAIQEMAVLLRKPGEVLPHRRRQRVTFIDRRAPVFRNLPLNIVLDVRFFFLHILKNYKTTRRSNSSLRVQAMKLKHQKNHAVRRGIGRKGKRRGR